jgi:hypothetical protein
VVARDQGSLIGKHLIFHPQGTIEVDPAWRKAVFYADRYEADVALAQSLLKPNGLRPATDQVHVGANFESVRRFYIMCRHDRAISPSLQHDMYTTLPCELVLRIASSHSPFFSHLAALLRALERIVRA